MTKKIVILALSASLIYSFSFLGKKTNNAPKSEKMEKNYDFVDRYMTNESNPGTQFDTRQIIPEGSKDNYGIGPEIPTGLTGFYNYQFNGTNGHYIYRDSPSAMHVIYMTNPDSAGPYPSTPNRRTKYCFSTDGGLTWSIESEAPSGIRSGFCSLTLKNDGSAVASNHQTLSGNLTGFANYDLAPLIGVFTGVPIPERTFAWPQVTRTTDGNIFTLGTTYRGTAATDTTQYAIFNSTTNTFGTSQSIFTSANSNSNSSIAIASGPNNKVIVIINAYRESGGNWGFSRIYATESTNNGQTFPTPTVVFDPHVILGDSVVTNQNGATDVIYDNAGNWYMAFNSNGPNRFYQDLRLYVSKNGAEPTLVCGTNTSPHNPIPEAATSMLQQAFIASFDHPCLSISDDGNYLFVSFSVAHQTDTAENGFQKCHIYYSWSQTSSLDWQAPIRVTNAGPNSYDEKYASINRVTPHSGNVYDLYMTYQKCAQPGAYCTSPPDQSVIARASLMFRKISDATNPIGIRPNGQVVRDFRLFQNYPNPFNPSTKIEFNLVTNSYVELKVYDILGREVRTLVNGLLKAGLQEITLDASELPSGVYFYTIKAIEQGSSNIFRDTKKMILVK